MFQFCSRSYYVYHRNAKLNDVDAANDASSEHLLDELFIVDGTGLVLVGQTDHSVQFRLTELLSQRLEDIVELRPVDCTVAVDVKLTETAAHHRLPVQQIRTSIFSLHGQRIA